MDLRVSDVNSKDLDKDGLKFEIRFADGKVFEINPFSVDKYLPKGYRYEKIEKLREYLDNPYTSEARELIENYRFTKCNGLYMKDDIDAIIWVIASEDGIGINTYKAVLNNESFTVSCKEFGKVWRFDKYDK